MALPIMIDFEASGFGRKGYPIEVGFINEKSETWCALIKREEGWNYWNEEAESVHNISPETLKQYGRSAQAIAEKLNTSLENKIVYSDGWSHDYVWLHQLFNSAGMSPTFRLEDLRKILKPHQKASWHEVKDNVIKSINAPRHRASTDAKILQMTWLKVQELEA